MVGDNIRRLYCLCKTRYYYPVFIRNCKIVNLASVVFGTTVLKRSIALHYHAIGYVHAYQVAGCDLQKGHLLARSVLSLAPFAMVIQPLIVAVADRSVAKSKSRPTSEAALSSLNANSFRGANRTSGYTAEPATPPKMGAKKGVRRNAFSTLKPDGLIPNLPDLKRNVFVQILRGCRFASRASRRWRMTLRRRSTLIKFSG